MLDEEGQHDEDVTVDVRRTGRTESRVVMHSRRLDVRAVAACGDVVERQRQQTPPRRERRDDLVQQADGDRAGIPAAAAAR